MIEYSAVVIVRGASLVKVVDAGKSVPPFSLASADKTVMIKMEQANGGFDPLADDGVARRGWDW